LPKKLDEKDILFYWLVLGSLREAAPITLSLESRWLFLEDVAKFRNCDTITSEFYGYAQLGLFLPFLLAACLKTTSGIIHSAIVTTASIIGPS